MGFPVKFAKFLRTPFLQNTSSGYLCTVAHNDEKDSTLPEDEKIAETFDKFLGNRIKNLNIPINSEVLEDISMIF